VYRGALSQAYVGHHTKLSQDVAGAKSNLFVSSEVEKHASVRSEATLSRLQP
jgi:hypothetical protein